MDVSRKNPKADLSPKADLLTDEQNHPVEARQQVPCGRDPKGLQLIETVINLTGLPESLAHQELDHILKMSGRGSGTRTELTLDELREALLAYLDALQPTSVD